MFPAFPGVSPALISTFKAECSGIWGWHYGKLSEHYPSLPTLRSPSASQRGSGVAAGVMPRTRRGSAC